MNGKINRSLRSANALLAGVCVMLVSACAQVTQVPRVEVRPADPMHALNAVLWMQRSVEYRVSARQVYRDAASRLGAAMAPGTAAAEQEDLPGYGALPLAVILDIDETVLDNSPYQGWRIRTGSDFQPESWGVWIRSVKAAPIPGAVEFTQAASRAGMRVFYLSNRDCKNVRPAPCADKAATVENLKRAGLPLADADDVMFRGEREGWYGKEARRLEVARKYRIVMMLGDDMRDLLPTPVVDDLRRPGGEARHQAHMAKLGTRLFLLPNPAYGSWEDSLLEERCKTGDVPCLARLQKRRIDALDAAEIVPDPVVR
ncbi:MAG: HAD family acid phosphatase [Betaproteobacteria bacterium]